jgi:hypothetical protein
VEEAFGYEALLRQVGSLTRSLGADVPTLPGDEIPSMKEHVLSIRWS